MNTLPRTPRRATSWSRDGAALAGALLEEMDRVSISGIFATHLHELFDLPLNTKTLSCKRMGIDWVSRKRLTDGILRC